MLQGKGTACEVNTGWGLQVCSIIFFSYPRVVNSNAKPGCCLGYDVLEIEASEKQTNSLTRSFVFKVYADTMTNADQ